MASESQTTLGLTTDGQAKLRQLKEAGHFGNMVDAYRFAVALALARGARPSEVSAKRETIFNVGTLDRDGTLQFAVRALADCDDEPVEKVIERLAEWGVSELAAMAERGQIPFDELLQEARGLVPGAGGGAHAPADELAPRL